MNLSTRCHAPSATGGVALIEDMDEGDDHSGRCHQPGPDQAGGILPGTTYAKLTLPIRLIAKAVQFCFSLSFPFSTQY
ncbi:MAG: hypothetical protein U1B80_02010 [Anaerolineaceae bacterium]|nr:hypothetical protein [Anaerolineaceae bacterium]